MDARRSERIASAMRDELDEILNYELEDPRIGAIVIEEIILSPDGKKALARLTPEGDARAQNEALQAVNGAARHVRNLLAERLSIYRTPDVSFEAAVAPESAVKAASLMRRVRRGRPRDL
jgi:ribosome-binding factor A